MDADPNNAVNKRILVITELFMPTKGGTAVWYDEVYRRLGGKEIHIVTADVLGAAEHDRDHPNSVHRVSLRRHFWLRPESLAMYARLLWTSLTLLLRARFDQVHGGRVLPEGLVAWICARLIRKPLIVYAHGEEITTWRQPGKFRVMCWVYRHADLIIANSDFTREELLKLGVDAARIACITPGVDLQRFQPNLPVADLRARIAMQPEEKLILSVGRLSRRKGFDQVIRALPGLLKDGLPVRFALIGIGEDRDYLTALAKELGVEDRLLMLGHVAPDDLPRWYNACDVFAMPNREINGDTEGFGMVFIEAAACGKPVVAGMAGGTGAAVAHESTGLRIDGGSLEAVEGALKRLLTDPKLARALGQTALERARSEADWQIVAEKTLNLRP